jgi:repressor LexA
MITGKQKQVLDFIRAYYNEHDAYPSLEEIRVQFDLASVSTAHYYVRTLQERGYLHRENNRPRGMALIECRDMVKVSIVGVIAAGQPVLPVSNPDESLAVPRDVLTPGGDYFGLKVRGESMIDEHVDDGDIVIVRRQPTAENGDKVVALIDGYEATLKKFYLEGNLVRLQPANPRMSAIMVEADQVTIQGRVICVAKMQRTPEVEGNHES